MDNIVISDNANIVKLIDFGLAVDTGFCDDF